MARIAGVDLPREKRVEVGLTYVYGIGLSSSQKILKDSGINPDTRVKDLMIDWSKDENIWLKRTAIEHQLGLKDKTDTKLLEQIIINSFGNNEFFVNKAIGWALRDYSKTNSKYVKDFINKYKDKMNSLSIKEASKYI